MGVGCIQASFKNSNGYAMNDRFGRYSFEFSLKNNDGTLNF